MASRFAILRRAPSRNHDRAGSSRHTASLAECIDWRSRILKRIEAGDYIEALIRIRQRLHFANAEVPTGQAFAEIFDADLLVPSTQRLATSLKTNVGCEVLCHRKGAERATSPSFARVADRR